VGGRCRSRTDVSNHEKSAPMQFGWSFCNAQLTKLCPRGDLNPHAR
jgi:hypothetical protein